MSALGATGFGHSEGGVNARIEPSLSRAFSLGIQGGVHIGHGKRTFRDLNLTGVWRAVQTPTLQVNLRPGLNLPTGGLTTGLSFTPISTSSVDPTLAFDVVAGGRVVFAATGSVRVPLYKGWDTVRQGVYLQGDARVAYPLYNSVVWGGMSYVRGLNADNNLGKFDELAVTGGGVWTFHERASLNASVRVPIDQGPMRVYRVAGMAGVTWVVGKR